MANLCIRLKYVSSPYSGLGRYGDPLNPFGDLITMAQAWCLLKPGARALVGVPGNTLKYPIKGYMYAILLFGVIFRPV